MWARTAGRLEGKRLTGHGKQVSRTDAISGHSCSKNKEVFTGGTVNTRSPKTFKTNLHLKIRKEIPGWQSCEGEANRKLVINTALILFSGDIVLVKLMPI